MHSRRLMVTILVLGTVLIASLHAIAQIVVQPTTPTVLFGEEVGFRIEGRRGSTPVGQLVVKENGRWVVVELGGIPRTRPTSQK